MSSPTALFNLPQHVEVYAEGRWWWLRNSAFQHVAQQRRAGRQLAVSAFGRPLRARQFILPPENHPRYPLAGSVEVPRLWADGLPPQLWQRALDLMDLRPEVFKYKTLRFDIVRAKGLALRLGLPVESAVPTEDWWHNARSGIRVDPTKIDAVVLDKPCIFIELATHNQQFKILADGNHRATRGLQEDQPVRFVTIPLTHSWRALEGTPKMDEARRALKWHARRVGALVQRVP